MDRDEHHNAEGWTADGTFRWIEAGALRLVETEAGALVTIEAGRGSSGETWIATLGAGAALSDTELVGLAQQLTAWFTDSPTETLEQIETAVVKVRAELAAWDDRARADEEHPPYATLVSVLDGVIQACTRTRARTLRPVRSIRRAVADGIVLEGEILQAGRWRSCTGCHEPIEGQPTGPWSETFHCHLGAGCLECGGLGTVWELLDADPTGSETQR